MLLKRATRYLLAIYVFAAALIIFSTFASGRNYQDGWILDGILAPTIFFVLVFSVTATNSNDNRVLALLCSSFLAILSLIPQLKYQQIYGVFDSIAHYGFANRLISAGYVPQTGFYASEYSAIPGMHILLSCISIATGVPTTIAIKIVTVILPSIIPLLIYFVTKNRFENKTQKCILLSSAFSVPILFYISGTTFALLLYASIIYLFLRRAFAATFRREYTVCLLVFFFSLIISHGVTSIFLSLILLGAILLLKLIESLRKNKGFSIRSNFLLTAFLFTVSFLAWWFYEANFYLDTFIAQMLQLLTVPKSVQTIPLGFFRLSIVEQLQLLAVRYSNYIIVAVLGIIGLIVFCKMSRRLEHGLKTLYLYMIAFSVITLLLAASYVYRFPSYTYDRYIVYTMILSPFFVGLALLRLNEYISFHLRRAIIQKSLIALILFAIICVSLVQIYACQPLVPKTVDGEYVVDYRMANTIYQSHMISFAENHSETGVKIASDVVTSWQIFGLTNTSFHSGYTWINPLIVGNLSQNLFNVPNLILLHFGGKSGPLNEEVNYRTKSAVQEKFDLGDLIYNNGESFVINYR